MRAWQNKKRRVTTAGHNYNSDGVTTECVATQQVLEQQQQQHAAGNQ
jgi:hypothetical protein